MRRVVVFVLLVAFLPSVMAQVEVEPSQDYQTGLFEWSGWGQGWRLLDGFRSVKENLSIVLAHDDQKALRLYEIDGTLRSEILLNHPYADHQVSADGEAVFVIDSFGYIYRLETTSGILTTIKAGPGSESGVGETKIALISDGGNASILYSGKQEAGLVTGSGVQVWSFAWVDHGYASGTASIKVHQHADGPTIATVVAAHLHGINVATGARIWTNGECQSQGQSENAHESTFSVCFGGGGTFQRFKVSTGDVITSANAPLGFENAAQIVLDGAVVYASGDNTCHAVAYATENLTRVWEFKAPQYCDQGIAKVADEDQLLIGAYLVDKQTGIKVGELTSSGGGLGGAPNEMRFVQLDDDEPLETVVHALAVFGRDAPPNVRASSPSPTQSPSPEMTPSPSRTPEKTFASPPEPTHSGMAIPPADTSSTISKNHVAEDASASGPQHLKDPTPLWMIAAPALAVALLVGIIIGKKSTEVPSRTNGHPDLSEMQGLGQDSSWFSA